MWTVVASLAGCVVYPNPGRSSVEYQCERLQRRANVEISSVLHLCEVYIIEVLEGRSSYLHSRPLPPSRSLRCERNLKGCCECAQPHPALHYLS